MASSIIEHYANDINSISMKSRKRNIGINSGPTIRETTGLYWRMTSSTNLRSDMPITMKLAKKQRYWLRTTKTDRN